MLMSPTTLATIHGNGKIVEKEKQNGRIREFDLAITKETFVSSTYENVRTFICAQRLFENVKSTADHVLRDFENASCPSVMTRPSKQDRPGTGLELFWAS